MCSVYKITSLNDDRYYLLFSVNKNMYMSKILHRIIYNYTQSMKKKQKSPLDDAFIIIQKDNIKIEKVEREFKDKYECHNYIYMNMENCNCVNNKNDDYEPNDLLKVVVGVNRKKKTKQQMNREQYLKRKAEKSKCKIVLPNI